MDTTRIYISGKQGVQLMRMARQGDMVSASHADDTTIMPLAATCHSAADLGMPDLLSALGVDNANPLCLLVSSDGSRRYARDLHTKVLSAELPRGSFLEITPGRDAAKRIAIPSNVRVLVPSPGLALVEASQTLSRLVTQGSMSKLAATLRLIEFADECCGTYTRNPTNPRKGVCTYDKPGTCGRFATPEELRRFVLDLSMVKGSALAQTAARYAIDGSGSPMESFLNHGLALPPRLGGFSLPAPLANEQLRTDERTKALLKHASLRPDLQWPKYGTLAEYLGDEEHAGKPARIEDKNRMQDYAVANYAVFPLMYDDVRSQPAFCKTAQMIAREMSKHGDKWIYYKLKRRLRNDEFLERQATLMANLLPPILRYDDY